MGYVMNEYIIIILYGVAKFEKTYEEKVKELGNCRRKLHKAKWSRKSYG